MDQALSESVLVFSFSGLLNFVLASDQSIVKILKPEIFKYDVKIWSLLSQRNPRSHSVKKT
jgi:hypothetical protein